MRKLAKSKKAVLLALYKGEKPPAKANSVLAPLCAADVIEEDGKGGYSLTAGGRAWMETTPEIFGDLKGF